MKRDRSADYAGAEHDRIGLGHRSLSQSSYARAAALERARESFRTTICGLPGASTIGPAWISEARPLACIAPLPAPCYAKSAHSKRLAMPRPLRIAPSIL